MLRSRHDGTLYVIANTNNSQILKVTPDGKKISLLAKRDITRQCGGADSGRGDGGPASGASICIPRSLAIGPDGSLYIADTSNYRVRRIDTNGIITTVAGDGADCITFEILCGEGGPARAAASRISLRHRGRAGRQHVCHTPYWTERWCRYSPDLARWTHYDDCPDHRRRV